VKIPGHCSVTGEPVFDIISTWPAGHPFEGEPSKIGAAHVDAMRVTLVATNGTLMTLTVKESALPALTDELPRVWREVKARFRAERKAHRAFGQTDFNPEQHAHADAVNLEVNNNPPIGVLCVERWTDHGC